MQHKKDFVFGLQSVLETLRSDLEIEKLLISRGTKSPGTKEAVQLAKERGIPITEVPKEKLDRTTRKNHQGIICFISAIQYFDLDGIISDCFSSGKSPLLLVLDGITDIRNLGAISRTAECAGVNAIVVPKKGSAQITSDAMKTSSGALNHIKVCRVDNLTKTIKHLNNSGISTIACTEKTTDSIFKQDFEVPCAIIMGSEEDGISTDNLKVCSHRGSLPMYGEIGSLNVSVAAAVAIYEAVRQRES